MQARIQKFFDGRRSDSVQKIPPYIFFSPQLEMNGKNKFSNPYFVECGGGGQNKAYARRSGTLSREGSLLCHICCDTGPRFFRSHPKDRPIQSPLMTHEGMWRIYSNLDPYGVFPFGTKVAGTAIFLATLDMTGKTCFIAHPI